MRQQIRIDDTLEGEVPADQSRVILWDGVLLQLDLTNDNAAQMDDAVNPWLQHATVIKESVNVKTLVVSKMSPKERLAVKDRTINLRRKFTPAVAKKRAKLQSKRSYWRKRVQVLEQQTGPEVAFRLREAKQWIAELDQQIKETDT